MLRIVTTVVTLFGLVTLSGPALAAKDDITHHTGGRTEKIVEVETENAVFIPYERYQWPGVYFEAAFKGRQLHLAFDDDYNRYRLRIDDLPPIIIDKPGRAYDVTKLKRGRHTVRLEKLSESQGNVGTFYGFSAGRRPVTPLSARARQIEFIGDSFTVGYGNTSGKRQCTAEELRATTDTQVAYGPLTAKHLDADYQVNAFSGRGIVRNYDGFAGDPLPALYAYILYDKKVEYHDDAWKPQVIVIGLGGNDFSTPVKPGEPWADDAALKADYEKSFVAFVKSLREKNPQAFFLLTEYEGPVVAAEVEKVAAQLRAEGEGRLATISLDGFGLNGCDWHLDATDDKRISEQLIGWFEAHPDVWPGK